MRTILRLGKHTAIFSILFSLANWALISPAYTSDYITNYKRTPAIQNLPPQIAEWKSTPTVLICEHAPIDEVRVRSAVAFWQRLGYKILHLQSPIMEPSPCDQKKPTGYVTIHLITDGIPIPPTSLAETRFYVDNNTNEIEWATIYLRADVKKTVLEHELGHALGFLHFNKINHLMNEMWEMGGWDTDGLERKRE